MERIKNKQGFGKIFELFLLFIYLNILNEQYNMKKNTFK